MSDCSRTPSMEPITSWTEDRVSEWLQGLDAPLHQYPLSEWHLSGMDLLQLTSLDLERLGVHKIGHQELILEAVEKLCSLTYGIGGENLRGLTEKLRAVAHTLQMGIQGRWRLNSYDGRSTTKLPAGILQIVVELITSAKGLFSLLNRFVKRQLSNCYICMYEKEKDIISVGRQLVAVCDEILNSSPETLLTHTVQLESVDLVPVSPGDQLGIEITSTSSSNHYVTGTAVEDSNDVFVKILAGDEVVQVNGQIVVGWSRANLVKKLRENPNGVTLVLKKIPGSVSEEEEEEEEEKDEEENPRHSIFERVAASVRSLSFRKKQSQSQKFSTNMNNWRYKLLMSIVSGRVIVDVPDSYQTKDYLQIQFTYHPPLTSSYPFALSGMTTALSRRRVSCRELGHPDCDGWLWKKRRESSVFLAQKWQRFWFVVKGPYLYWYTSQQDEKAEGLVNIASYSIEGAGEHKRKYVFQMCHWKFQNFFFAADHVSDMEYYSETESESESSPSPRRRNKKVQSHTLPRPKGRTNKMPIMSPSTEGSKGTVDEMGMMLNNIKEGGVSLIGHEQPFTHDHFRKSFIRRNKNPVINEKAHTLRALQSTLKAKEAELQQISKILDDSDLTASKYRQWKEQNEELVQEIERLAALKAPNTEDVAVVQDTPTEAVALETVAKETAPAETEGAYRLSLSDGEQLVDAEPSDVLLEIPPVSSNTETSPVLELSLGSLQESINKQLSKMAESGEADENYFYI
uniref:Connector enhancer of kinase suppressor of Ras 1 n=1 Tax=Amphiprion ocellaris TaxID=80972 RepID=A0AAQ6AMU3_AMPOC